MRSLLEFVVPNQFNTQPVQKALALLTAVAVTIPGAASSRDYSLHMLAHVPKVCSFSAIRPYITLADDAASPSHSGSGTFLISCNVNYALSFSRIGQRGAIAPVAADEHGPALDLVVLTRGADGDPLEAACPAAALARLGSACDAVAAPGDVRVARPRAMARLQVTRSRVSGDGAPILSDEPSELPAGVSTAARSPTTARAASVDSVRMTISARL